MFLVSSMWDINFNGEFNRATEQLVGRLSGPMKFRLILQPVMAILFAILAGLRDVRQNKQPFFWQLLTEPKERRRLIHSAWRNLWRVLIFAFLIDSVYQIYVFKFYYPFQSLIVAFVLAVVPYIIIRGPVTRIFRRFRTNPH
jgi:hypothetical protein